MGASNEGFMTAQKDVRARCAERTGARVDVKGFQATQVRRLTTLIGQGHRLPLALRARRLAVWFGAKRSLPRQFFSC